MEAPADAYVSTGEVSFMGGGASFDANRVVGPRVNLSRRADGSWGGVLMDQPVDLSVSPGRVSGVNLTLAITQGPGGTVITGQWQGRILRFELGPEGALIRTPTRSFTLVRHGPNAFGPMGELSLTGEAALPEPPMPQLALALVATF